MLKNYVQDLINVNAYTHVQRYMKCAYNYVGMIRIFYADIPCTNGIYVKKFF